MRDTGRSPLHLLLDDRASRDGACGSGRRRRARGPARQPRTLRRQEDQGRPGKEGRHCVQEAHRRHHARTGHAGAYARKRSEPRKARADEARLANLPDRGSDGYAPRTRPAGDPAYVRVGSGWAYVCLLVGLADRCIAGYSVGRTRDAGLVLAAFATLDFPLTDVQVFHTDRGSEFDNTRIDELLDVFDIKRSLSRKGNPYDNAVVESMNRLLKKELVYRNHYTTIEQLRRDLNDYVWWSDSQRLHSTLGYRSPKEFTEQGLVL